jgi:hypothetical protein
MKIIYLYIAAACTLSGALLFNILNALSAEDFVTPGMQATELTICIQCLTIIGLFYAISRQLKIELIKAQMQIQTLKENMKP